MLFTFFSMLTVAARRPVGTRKGPHPSGCGPLVFSVRLAGGEGDIRLLRAAEFRPILALPLVHSGY